MMQTIARRILQIIPMLWVVATLIFLLLHVTPGGPVVALAGEFADADTVRLIEARLGLDRPLGEQYIAFIGSLAVGDFGQSFFYKAPVLDVIFARIPATLILVLPSLALSCIIGVPLGIWATRGSRAQNLILGVALVTVAIPVFWLGHLLRLNLSAGLGWFPIQGMTNPRLQLTGVARVVDIASHAALPVLTLTLNQLALIIVLTRSSVAAAKARPFFLTALAKGNSRTRAELLHALPNGSLPIVTLVANRIGWLIAGAVLVETVFAWPGLGQLITGAIANRDQPLVIGIVLFVTVVTLIANLIADLYALWLDPRIAEHRSLR